MKNDVIFNVQSCIRENSCSARKSCLAITACWGQHSSVIVWEEIPYNFRLELPQLDLWPEEVEESEVPGSESGELNEFQNVLNLNTRSADTAIQRSSEER
jgi:hypothetical protein